MSSLLRRIAVGWTWALLALEPFQASAEISLSQIIVDFEPGTAPVHDVEIRNLDEERDFVEVTVARVTNPGAWPMERQTSSNPTELGLVATPTKLVLPPKGAHVLRLIQTQPAAAEERIYRVAIVPKVADVTDSRSGVKVVVGYELLVIVRPQQMRISLQAKREGKRLTLTNTGNTNILIPTVRQCRAEVCKSGSGIRVYAGRTETITLPDDAPVEAMMTVGHKNWSETVQ